MYEYMPTNGYDVLMMLEGMLRGDKNADSKTGKAVKSDKKRPISESIESTIGKIYDTVTNSEEGTKQAERSRTYNRNATTKREDLRNLMMGFPIVNGTIEIAPQDSSILGGNFQDKYAFRFKDRGALRSINLPKGTYKQREDGYDMGHSDTYRNEQGTTAYRDYWDINPFTIIPGIGPITQRIFPRGVIGRGFDLYDDNSK